MLFVAPGWAAASSLEDQDVKVVHHDSRWCSHSVRSSQTWQSWPREIGESSRSSVVGGRRPSLARPGLRVAQWPPEAVDVALVADAEQVLLPYPAQPFCPTNLVQLGNHLLSLERAVWRN